MIRVARCLLQRTQSEFTSLHLTSPDSEFDPDHDDEEAGYEDEDEDQGEERECVLRARPPPNFTPSIGRSLAVVNERGKVGRSSRSGGASCNVCVCHETQYTSHGKLCG